MKKIAYLQRTYDELIQAYLKLKQRYKIVRFFKSLINGYYYGYFEVSHK